MTLNLKITTNYTVKSYLTLLNSKKKYFNGLISTSDNKIRSTWNIVKNINGKKINHVSVLLLNMNGHLTDNHQIMVNTFIKFFLTAADNIIDDNTNNSNGAAININLSDYLHIVFGQLFSNMRLRNTSTKEIEEIIKSLKSKNTYGYDGISTKILKASIPFISSPLTHICNKSLSSGGFPSHLKFSEIKPLLKKREWY
jgi:hypothetical protein